jgi:hypothetical protein
MLNTYNSYNPPHLPDANIWLNLDPNTIALTGTSVNQWGDNLSGLIFGQSSAAKKPTYNNTDVSFDGGDYLVEGSNTTYDTDVTGWTAAFRVTSTNWDSSQVVVGDDSSNNSFIRVSTSTSLLVKMTNGSGSVNKGIAIDTPSALVDNTYYNIVIQVATSGNIDVWVDGVLQTSSPTINAAYDLVIDEIGAKNGNTQQLNGNIQEIIMYNKVLSNTEVSDIFSYLTNKF